MGVQWLHKCPGSRSTNEISVSTSSFFSPSPVPQSPHEKKSLANPFMPSANTCTSFPSLSVIPQLFKSTGGACIQWLPRALPSAPLPSALALLPCSKALSFIQMPPISLTHSLFHLSFILLGLWESGVLGADLDGG